MRNDGEQHEVVSPATEMNRGFAAIDLHRAVARVIVEEWSAAGEFVGRSRPGETSPTWYWAAANCLRGELRISRPDDGY